MTERDATTLAAAEIGPHKSTPHIILSTPHVSHHQLINKIIKT